MAAGPIVKPLHILKDCGANVLPGWVRMRVHEQLRFRCSKEALDNRILPAIAPQTHGAVDSAGCQPLLIRYRPILTASIRMMEEADRHGALLQRHLERAEGQGRRRLIIHGPADNAARIEV